MGRPILDISRLTITYAAGRNRLMAVDDASLAVYRGETVVLVGDSGAGKSTIGRAAVGIIPDGPRVSVSGSVVVFGMPVRSGPSRALTQVRKSRMGYLPQEPVASFNPLMRIGPQICERGVGAGSASDLLRELGLSDVRRIMGSYPQQLSGGEAQRAALARAIAVRPRFGATEARPDATLLVVDEPTTSLDSLAKCDLLEILNHLKRARGWSILLITHDLDAATAIADRVLLMERGRVVDEQLGAAVRKRARQGPRAMHADGPDMSRARAGADPESPAAAPRRTAHARLDRGNEGKGECAAVQFESVHAAYPSRRAASGSRPFGVRGVSLSLERGQCTGILGPSGSGKTTLLRLAAGLMRPDQGLIRIDDSVAPQMVYQDFGASLTPWLSIGAQIVERVPRLVTGAARRGRVSELLQIVGLSDSYATARPDQLSGGQKQRAAIARALATDSMILLLDEPTAALDTTSVGQLATVVRDLTSRSLTIAVASHDLDFLREVCHRIVVVVDGRVVESGSCSSVFAVPRHPSTAHLLHAEGRLRRGLDG